MDPSLNPSGSKKKKSPSSSSLKSKQPSNPLPYLSTSPPRTSPLVDKDKAFAFLSEIRPSTGIGRAESPDRFKIPISGGDSESAPDSRHYDERDYQSHRRGSFPHIHHPLKPLHTRSSRKKSSVSRHSESETPEPESTSTPIHERGTSFEPRSEPLEEIDQDLFITEETGDIIQDKETGSDDAILETRLLLHKPDKVSFADMSEGTEKKVQFELGAPASYPYDLDTLDRRKHRRLHVKYDDPQGRLRQGSDLTDASSPLLQGPEAHGLDAFDLDYLSTHRFDNAKTYRRHKFATKEATTVDESKSKYDHQPHEIFVELDVLSGQGDEREWKETARWIKYEEDVEEGAGRWGRPHVASLSFHSLIDLRQLIEIGVCLLDLEERDLPGVAYRVVEQMVVQELIYPEERGVIMRSLLLKHRHVDQHEKTWKFHTRRNSGSLSSLQNTDDKSKIKPSISIGYAGNETAPGMHRRNSTSARLTNITTYEDGITNGDTSSWLKPVKKDELIVPIDTQQDNVSINSKASSTLSEEDSKWASNKESILRRIPVGAEASLVLVGKDDCLQKPVMAFVRLAEAVFMPNITEVPVPVRFVFILLGPSSPDIDYKEAGRSISTLMSNTSFHEITYKANDRKDLLRGIHDFLDDSIVLPPGDFDDELLPFEELKERSKALKRLKEKRKSVCAKSDPSLLLPSKALSDKVDPLKRTGKLFGGFRMEVKRRIKHYLSDWRDGCNSQAFASVIFIYFAAVSGAIAFGGLLAEKTNKHIGISETLVGSSFAGIVFSIFSGQPLLILGVTGPLLLFDESLYKFCSENDVDFLVFRVWIGIWLGLIGVLAVALEGSFIARYFSRFVQEIFAILIALLFIVDAFTNVIKIYAEHPIMLEYGNWSQIEAEMAANERPNTALLSTVLCLGTFGIAYLCRTIRQSDFFTNTIRKFLGNFAVPLAIVIMVGIDYLLEKRAYTEKLNVPSGLENSKPRDSWFIDPSNLSAPMMIAAVIPAMLVYILIFMETSICGLIIAKPEHNLVKGSGYHIDIMLMTLINTATSFIGSCWFCAATVRSVAHATSLVIHSTNNPPGEKPYIVGVYEQRLTNLLISLLIGLSVLMSPALVLIPLAVLFGVFLYMGVSSLFGIQLFERIALLFKQVEKHPQVPYVRRVRTFKMHLFTLIQVLCLAVLWVIKSMPSPVPLTIPFILILLVPLRFKLLPYIFTKTELGTLDSDSAEPDIKETTPEPEEVALLSNTPVATIMPHTNGTSNLTNNTPSKNGKYHI